MGMRAISALGSVKVSNGAQHGVEIRVKAGRPPQSVGTLTEEQVRRVRSGEERLVDLAAEFGMKASYLTKVRAGEFYAWVI